MGSSKGPNRTSLEHALHQKYLAQVIETVGRLTLATIDPNAPDAGGALLEEVYIDLPTECSLLAEVKEAAITDWWIGVEGREGRRAADEMWMEAKAPAEGRLRAQNIAWQDTDALLRLLTEAQNGLDIRRRQGGREKVVRRIRHDESEAGTYTVVSALSTGQIADACRRLVVLGAPGSGKSTFVRHLALCLAGEAQEHRARAASLARLPGWTHGTLTPIYVELRRFVASSHFPDGLGTDHLWAERLWNYIRAEILGEALAAYAPFLEQALRAGEALLILDGLDEVPYPAGKGNLARRRKQLQALAASLDVHYGSSRIVVASRPYAYANWQLEGYSAVCIAPFDEAKRAALAANLFRVSGQLEPELKAQRLNAALEQQNVSPELADNPLFITLMATLFARPESGENLPSRKGALYRESVLLLLERWTKAKKGMRTLPELLGNTEREELLARLAGLAYEVHDRYGADKDGVTPEIPAPLLCTLLFQMQFDDPTVNAHGLLSYLSENAGLLVSPGHGQEEPVFRFAHRTFQEYLAARHLVALGGNESYVAVRAHITRQPDMWRTPCLLVGDVLRDDNHEADAYGRLWRLVDHLMEGDAPEIALPAGDAYWWPTWLAAGIVEEQQLFDPSRHDRGNAAIRQSLVGWLVKLLETAGALQPVEWAHCGRVLALLGDPRPGVGVRRGLPEMVWGRPVPPGEYEIGGDEDAFQSLPSQTVSVSYQYRLSIYPVTHSQFQCFVDADSSGYNDRSYWTPEGWQWKGDRRVPEDVETAFCYSNHPRVNVSWYEALAFCRWLTSRYREYGLLERDEIITLPTEEEWEIGCRGMDGLIYPYGNAFDALKSNTADTGIGMTSAVGIFPDGVSPYGLFDLSGNVWEWCLTAYEDGFNEVSGGAARVLRGGSWDFYANFARAAVRNYGHPYNWNVLIGFRVVCLPHLKS